MMDGSSLSSDALDSLISTVFTIFVTVLLPTFPLVGGVIVIVGLFRVVNGYRHGADSSGWSTVYAGVGLVLGGIFLPGLLRGVQSDLVTSNATGSPTASPSHSPQATPLPVPSSPPSVAGPPADLTWMWAALGGLLGLVLLVVLARVLMVTVVRARQELREARTQKAAVEAEEARRVASWQAYRDRHNALLQKYLHAETDWDCLFFTPALTDPSVPATVAMLRAMQHANNLRDTAGDFPSALSSDADLSMLPYPRAVDEFDNAWDTAERNARRLGQNGIPAAERKTIREIRTLLELAENGAASETERALSYRRAQTLIAGLQAIHVPEQALAQLEERHRLMISADVSGNRATGTGSEEQG